MDQPHPIPTFSPDTYSPPPLFYWCPLAAVARVLAGVQASSPLRSEALGSWIFTTLAPPGLLQPPEPVFTWAFVFACPRALSRSVQPPLPIIQISADITPQTNIVHHCPCVT